VLAVVEKQRETLQGSQTWHRVSQTLNLSDLPKLGREPGFWGGIVIRAATLVGFLLFLDIAGDLTDMNELVFQGLANLLHGICPYGQTYVLATYAGSFVQTYFNYPPFAVLFHLPTLLWPGPQSLGTIQFMPGILLVHTAFDFILYYRLHQAGHSRAELMLWVNPGMVFIDIITFVSLPLLLVTLTILNLDKPVRTGLYSSLLAASYQLGVIFLPFILLYQYRRRQLTKTIMGLLPVLGVVLAFFLWNPTAFVNDLLLAQLGRGYVNWLDANPMSVHYNRYYPAAFLFMGSLPSVIFNIAIGLGIPPSDAPQIALPMMAVVGIAAVALLVHFARNPRKGLAILYPGCLLALLIASGSEGLTHYWVMTITLPFLAWAQHRTFSSSSNATAVHSPSGSAALQRQKTKNRESLAAVNRRSTRLPKLNLLRRLFDAIELDLGDRIIRGLDGLPFISGIRSYRKLWSLFGSHLTLELGAERGFGSVGICNCIRTDLRPHPNLDALCDATHLPFRDHVFDRTWCVYLAHHIPDTRGLVEEGCRVADKFYLYDFLPGSWLHGFSVVWDLLFFREHIEAAKPRLLRAMAPNLRQYRQGRLGGVLYVFRDEALTRRSAAAPRAKSAKSIKSSLPHSGGLPVSPP
jgi:SAM-dependent methyltransferase